MQKTEEASPSIILAGRALLVKMFITLEPHGIFGSPSIILAGRALLVKMLITLEPEHLQTSKMQTDNVSMECLIL